MRLAPTTRTLPAGRPGIATNGPLRVILAMDDRRFLRPAMGKLSDAGMRVAAVRTLAALRSGIIQGKPHVVLLGEGHLTQNPDLGPKLRRDHPGIPVIVVADVDRPILKAWEVLAWDGAGLASAADLLRGHTLPTIVLELAWSQHQAKRRNSLG